MIRTLITAPYELARLPLVIIDDGLARRLPETSVARTTLNLAIGSADKVAGTLTRDRVIAKRGTDRLNHAEKVRTAARLEQEATSLRERARETRVAGTQEADQKRHEAQTHAVEGLDEARVAEARGKQQAKATAAKTASAKKAAADKRAATAAATVAQRKERATKAAEANKRAAQRKTAAEVKEARETKQAATEARADAERLSDLAAAKKQERQQS